MVRLLILLVLAMAVAACGGSGGKSQKLPDLPPDVAHRFRADPEARNLLRLMRVNRTAAFGKASDLAKEGHCQSAVPVLQCLARDGQGAAPSQFLLGRCLLANGDNSFEEGLLEAQRRLFDIYRNGEGVPVNRVDAQKWLTLAETNQVALSLGRSVETDYVIKRNFDRSLTEQQKLAGAQAARSWRRQYWNPGKDEALPVICGGRQRENNVAK